jgi:DNA-binding MarR family transcriptional regulator
VKRASCETVAPVRRSPSSSPPPLAPASSFDISYSDTLCFGRASSRGGSTELWPSFATSFVASSPSASWPRDIDVESQQHQLLFVIKALRPPDRPTLRTIAERLQIQHNSAVELVKRSVERGLIERRIAREDRREASLHLTGIELSFNLKRRRAQALGRERRRARCAEPRAPAGEVGRLLGGIRGRRLVDRFNAGRRAHADPRLLT